MHAAPHHLDHHALNGPDARYDGVPIPLVLPGFDR